MILLRALQELMLLNNNLNKKNNMLYWLLNKLIWQYKNYKWVIQILFKNYLYIKKQMENNKKIYFDNKLLTNKESIFELIILNYIIKIIKLHQISSKDVIKTLCYSIQFANYHYFIILKDLFQKYNLYHISYEYNNYYGFNNIEKFIICAILSCNINNVIYICNYCNNNYNMKNINIKKVLFYSQNEQEKLCSSCEKRDCQAKKIDLCGWVWNYSKIKKWENLTQSSLE